MRVYCPICRSKASVRHSLQITPTVRQYKAICLNVECGVIFGGHVTSDIIYRDRMPANNEGNASHES